MARDNEANTLKLHIKVNGQNLSAISEKCNIGTLRIPSDPSWPKIPRRSTINTNDIIEPPCVVTLTGTPRKGRSVVQNVASRHLKSRLSQRYEAITYIPKRLPGCFDPRFRRQISRQKAEKPDEFYVAKDEEETPESRTEKLGDKLRETAESVDDCTSPCHDADNLLSSVTKSGDKIVDYPTYDEQSSSEAKLYPTSLQYAANEQYDVGSRSPREEKQETNRPLFLMVNEKRIQALPIDTVNVETASSPAQSLRCYSVQIPLVAYRDIPLQISSIPAQMEKDVKTPAVCQNSVKNGETVEDIRTGSTDNGWMYRGSRDEGYPLDNVERCNAKSSEDISERKSISNWDRRYISDQTGAKENLDSNVKSLNRDITKEFTLGKDNLYGNCDALKLNDAGDVDDGESLSYSNLNTTVRLKNPVGQDCATDSRTANGEKNERETLRSSEREMTENWMCTNTRTQNVKDDRESAGKSHVNVTSDKILDRATAVGQVGDKEYRKSKKERQHGELRVNAKRKAAPTNPSRKAKSFFRKRSRLAITDSDCTLILPGCRGVKVRYNPSKRGRMNSRSLTNLRVGDSIDKPSSIPLETRELLNKSYWEYYWKLGRKIKSDNAKEGDECLSEDHLPESQTLRQCSVLSCMINTALRDSTADQRPSSDPAANVTSIARENIYQASALPSMPAKIQRRKTKRTSKRLLGLRAIALLCIAVYIAVIFLPVMYDYFFDEEYDDENTNYIELIFQYVASSFEEALDRVIDVLTTILLRPVRFGRKR